MRYRILVVLLAAFLAATGHSAAQQRPDMTGTDLAKTIKRVSMTSTMGTSPSAIQSVITGLALATDSNRPLPSVLVHLRNLDSKQIEQRAVTNDFGEFIFVVKPKIPYVVEIADRTGRIYSASEVITPELGEVAGAVVRLPGQIQAMAGMFKDTAATVMAAASGTGFTAVDSTKAPPVSPEK